MLLYFLKSFFLYLIYTKIRPKNLYFKKPVRNSENLKKQLLYLRLKVAQMFFVWQMLCLYNTGKTSICKINNIGGFKYNDQII